MAVGSREASTSVAAFDHSFAAGLLEAATQLHTDYPRVLFVAHDTPYPEPLALVRPITAAFAVAFVLSNTRTNHTQAALSLDLVSRASTTIALPDPSLESLRLGNPAARSLPLLAALAREQATTLDFTLRSSQTLALTIDF
jgi:hypothetical protein